MRMGTPLKNAGARPARTGAHLSKLKYNPQDSFYGGGVDRRGQWAASIWHLENLKPWRVNRSDLPGARPRRASHGPSSLKKVNERYGRKRNYFSFVATNPIDSGLNSSDNRCCEFSHGDSHMGCPRAEIYLVTTDGLEYAETPTVYGEADCIRDILSGAIEDIYAVFAFDIEHHDSRDVTRDIALKIFRLPGRARDLSDGARSLMDRCGLDHEQADNEADNEAASWRSQLVSTRHPGA